MNKTYENFEEWLKEHDAKIRSKTIDEFVEYLKEYMWWSTQADENVVGEFALGEYAIAFKDMLRRNRNE